MQSAFANRIAQAEPQSEQALERVALIAEEVHAPSIAMDVRSVIAKVATAGFYVACVGQFKRGKSSLLDALIGEPLLPIGVLPVTSVPTVIRNGSKRGARVRLGAEEWRTIGLDQLKEYVSEEENPENSKGVSAVEVVLPHPLLANGLCLVDTPGIGSVFEGNTEATHGFVPHIDAAIVVLGADPPISAEELSLVQRIGRNVPDCIFVLNKADRVSPEDRVAAKEFAMRLLSGRLGRSIEIFEVSAKQRLAGAQEQRDWPLLVAGLERLATHSGGRLAEKARRRGTERVVRRLSLAISDERTGMLRPIKESERNVERLERYVVYAEQSLLDLRLLLIGEEKRLTRVLIERRKAFVASVDAAAKAELGKAARQSVAWGPSYRRRLMATAQEIARNRVLPWLAHEQQFAEAEYRKVQQRHVKLATDFLREISGSGMPEIAYLESTLPESLAGTRQSSFYFHEMSRVARPASPFRHLADMVLGAVGAHNVILRDAEAFQAQLLEVNSSRVQADVEDQLAKDRSYLDAVLRKMFEEVRSRATQTLRRVRETQSAGEAAVTAEVARLTNLENELATLFPEEIVGDDLPRAGDVQ